MYLEIGFPTSHLLLFHLQSSLFNTDEVNRMGIHAYLRGFSDKMWDNGKSIIEYVLKRGGRMGTSFKVA